MRELKAIIFITCGMLFGYFFEEEIKTFQYYDILYSTLFALAISGVIFKKQKTFKQKTFVKAKYDDLNQVLQILVAITITVFTLFHWMPNSYFHWLFLFLGIGSILNSVFYESTIQLYIKDDELYIQYSNTSYYKFDKVDSFNFQGDTLKIHFDDTRIEVYMVKMEQTNVKKLTDYLGEFQVKKNTDNC